MAKKSRQEFSKRWLILAGVGLVLLVTVVAVVVVTRPKPIISGSIVHKAGFQIFYPTDKQIAVTSVQYDEMNHGVSYKAALHGKQITVSEQATPQIFSDGPVYAYKLQQSHEFASFDTDAGHVSLTKPDELKGQVVAVVNAKGTLLFARSNQSVSTDEWKLLFNAMQTAS